MIFYFSMVGTFRVVLLKEEDPEPTRAGKHCSCLAQGGGAECCSAPFRVLPATVRVGAEPLTGADWLPSGCSAALELCSISQALVFYDTKRPGG